MRLSVKWFDAKKGHGFLIRPGHPDVFVHYKAILGEGRKDLIQGQTVECGVEDTPKGPRAANVKAVGK